MSKEGMRVGLHEPRASIHRTSDLFKDLSPQDDANHANIPARPLHRDGANAMRIVLFNKPFQVMPQFSGDGKRATLADFLPQTGIYPAGRLDFDSEGLMLLTDTGAIQHWISAPAQKMSKTYFVQIEGIPDETALQQLCQGVQLNDGITRPAKAEPLLPAPEIWLRDPPIRVRKTIPDSWLSLSISEGRNRQVRRMTAAVGHPTLRLVRWRIGPWCVEGLAPGQWRELSMEEICAGVPAKVLEKAARLTEHQAATREKTVYLSRSTSTGSRSRRTPKR